MFTILINKMISNTYSYVLIFCFLTCCFSQNSGIKMGLDLKVLKLMESLNLNKIIANKTLLPKEGFVYEKTSFPSVKLFVNNTIISSISNPESVDVQAATVNGQNGATVEMKNVKISLFTDFNIKLLSIFKDKAQNSPISVVMNSLETEFTIVDGKLKFSKMNFQIGEISVELNSYFMKAIYSLGKGFIIKQINSQLGQLKTLAENAFDTFSQKELYYDVGFGIGINATTVDKPSVSVFERTRKIFKTKELTFLGEKANLGEDYGKSAILSFGIHGSVYPNLDPSIRPDIESADAMSFPKSAFNNKISLLLSDYSLNTVLFMIQQTGQLKKTFSNDTQGIMPFTIDTVGVSEIVPEISKKYPENKKVQLDFYVDALDHKQPLLNTLIEGGTLGLNFGMDVSVYDSNNPYDDPVKELQTEIKATITVQYLVDDSKLIIMIYDSVIDEVKVISDELGVNTGNLHFKLEKLLDQVVVALKPELTDIDVLATLKTYLGKKMSHMRISAEDGYHFVTVDIDDL